MAKSVVIIGAGGHAKVVADIVSAAGDRIVGFLDGVHPSGKFMGYDKLGTDDEYANFLDCHFVIAIGNASVREQIAAKMKEAQWYTAIHPTASISESGTGIGEGTVVMANAIVNAGARIGKHAIINSGAIVEHDNRIGDFAHISVGAKLAGAVTVGQRTWIGVGATVSNGIRICDDVMVGAGGVVVRDITENGTYVGVPVRKIA